jgi:shikimate kinase
MEQSTVAGPELIFLIGYRGSGKTCVAKLLAQRLGWQWLDADELLAARAGRSIKEIFAEEGETGFRNRESELLAELSEYRRHVIATGGGVIVRQENRERLRKGHVVWLTAEPETLWQRIDGDSATILQRPDLAGGGLHEVQQLLRSRAPHYADSAHLVVDTENCTPEMVAERVLNQLKQGCGRD